MVIVNSARFFFQIIEERFRLPPSSEMHIPTDWGEYIDFEEINQLQDKMKLKISPLSGPISAGTSVAFTRKKLINSNKLHHH